MHPERQNPLDRVERETVKDFLIGDLIEIRNLIDGLVLQGRSEELAEEINKIIREKMRFGHIFYSKLGSLYLVIKSGQSLRLDCSSQEAPKYKPDRIFPHIMFVSPKMTETIRGWTDDFEHQLKIQGHDHFITTQGLAVGATPIEYDTGEAKDYMRSVPQPEQRGSALEPKRMPLFAVHIGHPVTEIV